MLPKVRKLLTEAIKQRMHDECLNWQTIQKVSIKNEWDSPFGWSTLRKIVKDESYYMMPIKQVKLLEFFEIEYNYNFGVITIPNELDYEQSL